MAMINVNPTEDQALDRAELTSKTVENSKHFCMLPWTHMHVLADGMVTPCCVADNAHPIGHLNQASLKSIWNSQQMKDLRLNMLNDKPSEACRRCYAKEDAEQSSYRNESNKNFRHHLGTVEETMTDGSVARLNLPYIDIRFSNFCNLRCRSCSPLFSSQLFKEHSQIFNSVETDKALVSIADAKHDIWKDLEEISPHIERIYFAGGEPLIMQEHYRLLKTLISQSRFDVELIYNTNLSTITYKDLDLVRLWKQFKNITVFASLDASHARGELIRKNLKWDQAVANATHLKEHCPKINLKVGPTISIMNAWHIVDFHREWLELGLIKVNDFVFNQLIDPNYFCTQIMPKAYKKRVEDKYQTYIADLSAQYGDEALPFIGQLKSAIHFMNLKEAQHLLKDFLQYTDSFDKIRNECFWNVFPELVILKE